MSVKYLVQNNAHIPLQFHGNVLASSRSSVHGVAGKVWVTEAQMETDPVKRFVSKGYLTVVERRPPIQIVEAPVSITVTVPVDENGVPDIEAVVEILLAETLSEEELLEMKVVDLRKLAAEKDIKIKGLRRKVQIVSAILNGG